MANTYVQIGSTVTVTGTSAVTMDFTSIPSTYTDLVLKLSIRTTVTSGNYAAFRIFFNGLETNISSRYMFGNGSATGSSTESIISIWANTTPTTASTFNNAEVYIPNYAGSANKSVSIDGVVENNASGNIDFFNAGLWSSTAAINQITLKYGDFAQYSTASLYGIKKN